MGSRGDAENLTQPTFERELIALRFGQPPVKTRSEDVETSPQRFRCAQRTCWVPWLHADDQITPNDRTSCGGQIWQGPSNLASG